MIDRVLRVPAGPPVPLGRVVALVVASVVALAVPLGLATSPTAAGAARTGVDDHAAARTSPQVALVRAPELVAVGDPSTAVVAGPAGSDLVGQPFQVIDDLDRVVAQGKLVAVPEDLEDDPVDPAPFGEVALAELPRLDVGGDYTVVAAGASDVLRAESAPYAPFLQGLLDLFEFNADGRESRRHGASHLHDKAARIANGPLKGTVTNLLGGYMDAGDQVKFTLTVAHAAVLLELALSEATSTVLRDQLRRYADIAIRYLRRTHPAEDLFVSLVGHVETDHDAGFRDPAEDDRSDVARLAHRPAYAFTRRTGGSDAAGMVATALALASTRTDGPAGTKLVAAARDWLALAEELQAPWRNDYYPTATWRDDVAMAQVAIAAVTGDGALAATGAQTLDQALAPQGEVRGWQVQVDGYDMGAVPAAMLCGVLQVDARTLVDPGVAARGCDLLAAGVRDAEYKASFDAFGLPAAYVWGTSRSVGSAVVVAQLADASGDRRAVDTVRRGYGWFLGANPWGVRFQAGYGVEEPYHWAQVLSPDPRPVGAVVGGPAPVESIVANTFAPAYEPGPYDTARVGYRDHRRDYVSNEVSLGYQAPWVLAAALSAR